MELTATLDRLEEMAEKAAAAWPSLPQEKIDRAMDYVVERKVTFRGNLPKTGNDEWDVDGMACSHKAQQCQCRESGPTTKLGRICSHRLAVMFRMRLDEYVLTHLKDAYAAAPDDVRVVLFAEVIFGTGTAGRDRWRLKGWRVNGHGTTMIDYDGMVELTEERLGEMLRKVGWHMTGKQQQGGHTYHAYTEKADEWHAKQHPEVDTSVGRMQGWSPYAKEKTESNRRMGDLFVKSLNENMQEVAA